MSYSLPTSFNVAARKHPHIKLLTPPDVYWLGQQDRLFGANYGEGMFSRLWQEYAKADRRWGGTDLGVVSLEVLTVFVGAPLACKSSLSLFDSDDLYLTFRGGPCCNTRRRSFSHLWLLTLGKQYGYASSFGEMNEKAR